MNIRNIFIAAITANIMISAGAYAEEEPWMTFPMVENLAHGPHWKRHPGSIDLTSVAVDCIITSYLRKSDPVVEQHYKDMLAQGGWTKKCEARDYSSAKFLLYQDNIGGATKDDQFFLYYDNPTYFGNKEISPYQLVAHFDEPTILTINQVSASERQASPKVRAEMEISLEQLDKDDPLYDPYLNDAPVQFEAVILSLYAAKFGFFKQMPIAQIPPRKATPYADRKKTRKSRANTAAKKVKLFGVNVYLASRDTLSSAVSKAGLRKLNIDQFTTYYDSSTAISGSETLRLSFTPDNLFALAEYSFPVPASTRNIFAAYPRFNEVISKLTSKYGPPHVKEKGSVGWTFGWIRISIQATNGGVFLQYEDKRQSKKMQQIKRESNAF